MLAGCIFYKHLLRDVEGGEGDRRKRRRYKGENGVKREKFAGREGCREYALVLPRIQECRRVILGSRARSLLLPRATLFTREPHVYATRRNEIMKKGTPRRGVRCVPLSLATTERKTALLNFALAAVIPYAATSPPRRLFTTTRVFRRATRNDRADSLTHKNLLAQSTAPATRTLNFSTFFAGTTGYLHGKIVKRTRYVQYMFVSTIKAGKISTSDIKIKRIEKLCEFSFVYLTKNCLKNTLLSRL